MDVDEYRRRGKEMVDYIADYLQTVRSRNVFPDVQPGYMRDLIPEQAPIDGENWEDIFKDIERVIMPGVTHWQSPHMHAYFPALNSCPSLLGDMLADAIGCLGFTWASSPACTELEVIVMDWLAKAIGLPAFFLHNSPDSRGGGVLQSTASEATLIAMLAARTDTIARIKEDCGNPEDFEEGSVISRLVVYCSDQAHSSVEKASTIALVKLHTIPTDANLSLRGEALQRAINEDKQKGLVPFYLCATLGTTGACAFDNMAELGPICEKEKIWMHIDAAYAGTAFLCPEFRGYLKGIEYAGSFAFNPSKWLMVHFDCTAMWVKNSASLHRTFNVNPLYLKHDKTGLAIDYMHWQIPLSRRFRALKLWFVIRSFGIKGLQSHVRKGVRLAKLFEGLVRREPGFEVAAERVLGLVVFRLNGPNELSEQLLSALNHTGKIYVVPAEFKGKYVIRFTVTSRDTTEDDLRKDWNLIRQKARDVRVKFAECEIGLPMENGHGVTRNQDDDDDDDDCGEGHHGGTPSASDATVRKYDIITKTDDVSVRASFQKHPKVSDGKERDENSPNFFVNSDYFIENGDKGEFGSVVKYRKCDRNGKAIRDPSLELDDTEGAIGYLGKGGDKPALGYCGVLKICQHVNIMEEKQNEKLGGVYVRANCCECNTNVLNGKEKKRPTQEVNGQRK